MHQPLYRKDERQLDLLHEYRDIPAYCQNALNVASVDWCEWQANYFGGVLLAPKKQLLHIRTQALGSDVVVHVDTPQPLRVVTVAKILDISRDAARVRLAQVGVLTPSRDLNFRPAGLRSSSA